MGTRTIIKQQIMRQMVINEENLPREISNLINGNHNSSCKDNYKHISLGNETLPTLSCTITDSENHFGYCSPSYNNFCKDSNDADADAYSFKCNGCSEPINKMDSTYLLHNMCTVGLKYNQQPTNSEINNVPNNFNNKYHDINDIIIYKGQMSDGYENDSTFSCTAKADKDMTNPIKRPFGNSKIMANGIPSFHKEEKERRPKDRNKKESHNRIERKRRDFINQRIVELSNLLPLQMVDERESKKNKGNILKNSVIYIQYLQNETNNTANYVMETDLAFILIESYRKQIQRMQQQFQSIISQDVPMSPACQNLPEDYNDYLVLHDHNCRTHQSNNQLTLSSSNKCPSSHLEIESAFNVIPDSIHSSLSNNSLSTNYQIEENTGIRFDSFQDQLSSK